MTAVTFDASLLDYQETIDSNAKQLVFKHEVEGGSGQNYGVGRMTALYSEEDSVAAGGGANDKVDFMKLPPGTLIVGGWLYVENGFCATDNALANVGITYEDSDGTDDVDCLVAGIDTYDGASVTVGQVSSLPTGFTYQLGVTNTGAFPYLVTGGWGTVRLTQATAAIVTAKDVKICLYVILPF
jgi:hypothetical protein